MSVQSEVVKLLADGIPVYSSAAGRVGRIMSATSRAVAICPLERSYQPLKYHKHNHIHGTTTFRAGDKVELVEDLDLMGKRIWVVRNTGIRYLK